MALRARGLQGDRNLGLDPLERILEREVDLDLEATPTLSTRLGSSSAAVAEEASEEIAEHAEDQVAEVDVTAIGSSASVRGAEGVVLLALLWIGENVVGALDLLEALLGGGIPRIAVRVVLPGELAVGLLDLVGRRTLRHPKNLVRAFRRAHWTPPARFLHAQTAARAKPALPEGGTASGALGVVAIRFLRSRDHDAGRPQHSVAEPVALLEHFDH